MYIVHKLIVTSLILLFRKISNSIPLQNIFVFFCEKPIKTLYNEQYWYKILKYLFLFKNGHLSFFVNKVKAYKPGISNLRPALCFYAEFVIRTLAPSISFSIHIVLLLN